MDRFVYFGHDVTDVYTALALDDALTEMAVETGKGFIRSYVFSKPFITLGISEALSDINSTELAGERIEYTRRRTGGSAILLDENVLAYAIVQPRQDFDPNVESVHRFFGEKIGLALKSLGLREVYVGENFSLSLEKNPSGIISGNSVYNTDKAVLYHGIIVVSPLNINSISKYIKLRKTEMVDELDMISGLPSLEKVLVKNVTVDEFKAELGRTIAHHVSQGNYRQANETEREEAFSRADKIAKEIYKNPDWIAGKGRNTRSNLGFCLIALTKKWKEEKFYPVK